jgi:hypothetical protein
MQISGIRNELVTPNLAPGVVPVSGGPSESAGLHESGAFARAVRGLGNQIDVGEVQADAASHLRSYDTSTLIALQVGIYRYTEAVDLASKIVDRATSAVKTVLQGGGH